MFLISIIELLMVNIFIFDNSISVNFAILDLKLLS